MQSFEQHVQLSTVGLTPPGKNALEHPGPGAADGGQALATALGEPNMRHPPVTAVGPPHDTAELFELMQLPADGGLVDLEQGRKVRWSQLVLVLQDGQQRDTRVVERGGAVDRLARARPVDPLT